MKKLICFGAPLLGALFLLTAQDRTTLTITGRGGPPKLAIPELAGSGDAQKFMATFNQTLRSDLEARRTCFPPARSTTWRMFWSSRSRSR